MPYPPLLNLDTEAEYRTYFENKYCRGPIITFDGIAVRFKKRQFYHCFFESVNIKDDTFSTKRAERMDWIKAALEDPESERYKGWNKARKRYDSSRRVAVVMGNYVVIIVLTGVNRANFITAFVADSIDTNARVATLRKIRKGPKWK